MKKHISIFAVTLAILGLAFFLSCENNSTTNSNDGAPTEEEFEVITDVSDFGLDALKIAMDLSDTVMAMGGVQKPLFTAHKISDEVLTFSSLDYSYNEYWHIFAFTAVMIATENGQSDSINVSGVDSLRFSNDGDYVQYPDEISTDGLDIRQHIDMNIYGADGGMILMDDHASIAVAGESLNGDVITLNGTVNDSVAAATGDGEMQLSVCDIAMTSTQTYNALVIDDTQECPTSGTLGMSAAVDISCDSQDGQFDYESTWLASFVFSNGNVTVDVYSGGEHWTNTGTCGEDESF